jgi:hypothetical protein
MLYAPIHQTRPPSSRGAAIACASTPDNWAVVKLKSARQGRWGIGSFASLPPSRPAYHVRGCGGLAACAGQRPAVAGSACAPSSYGTLVRFLTSTADGINPFGRRDSLEPAREVGSTVKERFKWEIAPQSIPGVSNPPAPPATRRLFKFGHGHSLVEPAVQDYTRRLR